jgi:hypothetical protein
MNNSDMPAMPCTFQTPEDDLLAGGGADIPEWTISGGLTKREHFAGLALQGILANNHYQEPRRTKLEGMAIDAVAAADALLKELDK